jgi:hypothetical protein
MAVHDRDAYLPTRFICEDCHQTCDHALDHRVPCPFHRMGRLNKFSPLKALRKIRDDD